MIQFPSANIRSAPPRLERFQTSGFSPINGAGDVQDYGGKWRFTITFVPLTRADALEVESFINSPETFLYSPRGYDFPSFVGTARIVGSDQFGGSVNSDGWEPGELILKKGQWLKIGDQLNRVSADIVSDSSGVAALPLDVPQRAAPADNTVINYTNPSGVFRIDGTERGFAKSILFSDITIDIVEAYN
jgi:hypothetical protein